MKEFGKKMKNRGIKRPGTAARYLLCLLCILSILGLPGCGRRVILTTGFGSDELMRIGNTGASVQEYKVYLLDMQKRCENLFGEQIWETPMGERLSEMIRDKALSQTSRVKVMLLLAVRDNIMLTNAEESKAQQAAAAYLERASAGEKEYLGITQEELARMYEEYELAQKVYRSIGSGFEERFDSFVSTLDYDLNRKLLEETSLAEEGGLSTSPGFAQIYREFFEAVSEDDTAGNR